MAAFCGTCGKPIAADGKFCGACGAAQAPTAAQPVAASSGTSALKIILVVLVLAGGLVLAAGVGLYYFGKHKLAQWQQEHGVASVLPSATGSHHSSSSSSGGKGLLTKEEVSEIIGMPVTGIEMQGEANAHYKTAAPGFEAAIEIERKGDLADAMQEMAAARTVTHGFGGKADAIAGLGDDALFGAFNALYVRKDDVVLLITPPNLQMHAQMEQATKIFAQPMGSDAQKKEMDKLRGTMNGDPVAGSMAQPDAVAGATDLIKHAATERGNEYETKSRLMARQLAEKVLTKI